MKIEPLRPHPVVGNHMGRIHVQTSILDAVRHALKLSRGSYKTFVKWNPARNVRRHFFAGAIMCHRRNKIEYYNVMIAGSCGPKAVYKNPYSFNWDTKEVTINADSKN
jgi:hypothetical protein